MASAMRARRAVAKETEGLPRSAKSPFPENRQRYGAPLRAMNGHHLRFVLPQYLEHRNPANVRLHAVTSLPAWLALATLLSQLPIPVLGPALGNAGALVTLLAVLYWLPVDAASALFVACATALWASLPFAPWGPGHGLFGGVVLPLGILALARLVEHFAHVYHHEHAAFLKGAPRREAILSDAHAWVLGPFHFGLLAALDAGWRPALAATLAEHARVALRRRERVPWINWAKLVSCRARFVSAPSNAQELAEAVRDALALGLRVRVVASGFSWSSLSKSEDALIFCERLDQLEVDVSDPAHPTVWAGAGVTNRQLNRELARHGLCMPWNVVLETVRVGGIASTGTHGTGKATATVGDLVEALEVVDTQGQLRTLSEQTVGAEVMNAARVGLGLFGVIARVKLRVAPMRRVRQTDRSMPVEQVLSGLAALVAQHESVELYWFPFNRDAWVRTIDTTDAPHTRRGHGFWFRAMNFTQNLWAVGFFSAVSRFAPRLTPALLRVGFWMLPFQTRVLDLPASHHYRHWVELMPAGCMEVGFKADEDLENVRAAWRATERLVESYAARGLYPLNISLNVRFIGASTALLSPAHGEGLTCYIELMWFGRPEGWREFTSELCRAWLSVPGALPHWGKEFEHVDDVVALVRAGLGERRARFLAALEATKSDPARRFFNPMLRRVLLDDGALP